MKVIIAGSRYFSDYEFAEEKLDNILRNIQEPVEIVSGRCDRGIHTFTTDDGIKVYGADGIGERYAKERDYFVKPFPADWSLYGRSAGPIRNERMSNYATHLIAFYDGESKGTKSMIDFAVLNKLPYRIISISKSIKR